MPGFVRYIVLSLTHCLVLWLTFFAIYLTLPWWMPVVDRYSLHISLLLLCFVIVFGVVPFIRAFRTGMKEATAAESKQ